MDYYLLNKDNIIFRFSISMDALGVRNSLVGITLMKVDARH